MSNPTTATGTFTSCGAGQQGSVNYDCSGSSCANLGTGFPGVTCTTSGDTLSCSNGVACSGTTNYTSVFSFLQNATIVAQSQNVTVPGGTFIVSSDGTTGGTSVQYGALTNSTGPGPGPSGSSSSSSTSGPGSPSSSTDQPGPTLSASGILPPHSGKTTTSSSPEGSPTTSSSTPQVTQTVTSAAPGPLHTSGSSSIRPPSRGAFVFLFIFALGFLFQGASANAYDGIDERSAALLMATRDLQAVAVSERDSPTYYSTFAGSYSTYLTSKLNATNSTGQGFANNLLAEIAQSVCDTTITTISPTIIGGLLEDCIAAIYTGNALVDAEAEFLAIFGASLLCNYATNEALSENSAITTSLCSGPAPCGNLLTDPKNCGSCGNVCSTGVCANGACTSNTCTGETCATFGPCGPGGTCVCASTTEGTGYCVDGSTACDGLAICQTSLQCSSGEICAANSCCDTNVCVGATFCASNSTGLKARSLFAREPSSLAQNGSLAMLGAWRF